MHTEPCCNWTSDYCQIVWRREKSPNIKGNSSLRERKRDALNFSAGWGVGRDQTEVDLFSLWSPSLKLTLCFLSAFWHPIIPPLSPFFLASCHTSCHLSISSQFLISLPQSISFFIYPTSHPSVLQRPLISLSRSSRLIGSTGEVRHVAEGQTVTDLSPSQVDSSCTCQRSPQQW